MWDTAHLQPPETKQSHMRATRETQSWAPRGTLGWQWTQVPLTEEAALHFDLKGGGVLTSGGGLSGRGMPMNKRHSREKAQVGTSRSFCFINPVGWNRG